MSKAEQTRAYIIRKSAPVFNTKGYAGTSLTDLVQATGLTKGSIYGNFENKDEVALAAYEYNISLLHKAMNNAIGIHHTASARLKAVTVFYRSNWKRVFETGGCPILNAAIEADDNLPFLKRKVQLSLKHWSDRLGKIMDEGKLRGEIPKNLDSKQYAYTIITLVEGGIMLAKITGRHELLVNALDRIDNIIDTEITK